MKSPFLLGMLWFVDAVLILMHTLHRLAYRGLISSSSLLNNTIWSMSEEGRLPDLFLFGQEFAIVVILVVLFLRRGYPYHIWAGIFTYLMLDDILQIHERIGFRFADIFPSLFGIPTAEIAQLLFLGILGVTIAAIAWWLIKRDKESESRVSLHLTILLALASFFGVGMDVVQAFVMDITFISGLVKIVEDGGEMVVFSAILWYTYLLLRGEAPILSLKRRETLHS